MNLRRACEHGEYGGKHYLYGLYGSSAGTCPGGTEPTTEELLTMLVEEGVLEREKYGELASYRRTSKRTREVGAVTDTEALRRALDGLNLDEPTSINTEGYWIEQFGLEPIIDAARRWLALAEGDEGIRRRVAVELIERFDASDYADYGKARDAVLAAITEEGE